MADRGRSGDASTRSRIAYWVVGAGVGSVAVIAVAAIALSPSGERSGMSRLVLTAVLPLLGTWVGTVLAFYFARENLEAATESTLALAGRELQTPVTRVMIKESQITALDLGTEEQPEDAPLAAIQRQMATMEPPGRRLPVRDAAGAVLYVVHDSTLAAFAEQRGKTSTELADETLGELLADAKLGALVSAIAFVPERATIADARAAMTSVDKCNDVFVTAHGKPGERAIGWLTNTLLAGVQ